MRVSFEQHLVGNGFGEKLEHPISFGEELPALDGHDESAWSRNRRVEFVYDAN